MRPCQQAFIRSRQIFLNVLNAQARQACPPLGRTTAPPLKERYIPRVRIAFAPDQRLRLFLWRGAGRKTMSRGGRLRGVVPRDISAVQVLLAARSQGRRPPRLKGPPPRHGDWAATCAHICSFADLASIKRYRLNLRSPHRGPTLRDFAQTSTVLKALDAGIVCQMRITRRICARPLTRQTVRTDRNYPEGRDWPLDGAVPRIPGDPSS